MYIPKLYVHKNKAPNCSGIPFGPFMPFHLAKKNIPEGMAAPGYLRVQAW